MIYEKILILYKNRIKYFKKVSKNLYIKCLNNHSKIMSKRLVAELQKLTMFVIAILVAFGAVLNQVTFQNLQLLLRRVLYQRPLLLPRQYQQVGLKHQPHLNLHQQ